MTQSDRELVWMLMLLRGLDDWRDDTDGRGRVTELEHCLQCAARAEQDNADVELVLVALLHDAAKPLCMAEHGQAVAAIVGHRLSPRGRALLAAHGDYQADLLHGTAQATAGRWSADAERLAAWDAASFDPGYLTPPLEHFLPALRAMYGVA